MSIQSQSRALMMRHHSRICSREQSMLLRLHQELGLDLDATSYHSHIQGQTPSDFTTTYAHGSSAMS